MPTMSIIPLFPLNVVLLPGSPLPLHIFEERYRELTRFCLESEQPFGIVFADDQGLRDIGCTARILKVIREYPDGRMDVLCEGEQRFRIDDLLEQKSYLEARVQEYFDEAVLDQARFETLKKAALEIIAQVFRLADQPFPEDHFREMEPELFSFVFAFYADLPKEARQKLIEMTETGSRLEYLIARQEEIVGRFELQAKIQRNGYHNGRPPKTDQTE